MNKQRVDDYMEKAIGLLSDCGIVDSDGKISKTFRGYISSFGAAITMGSLPSAIAFNSEQGGAVSERQKLMQIIYKLIKEPNDAENKKLLTYVIEKNNDAGMKEKIIDAAIAVKLAMNMYHLEKE